MIKLFRLLPVMVLVALVVACSFPLLALGVRYELWGFQLALTLLAGVALTAAILLGLAGVALLSALKHQQRVAKRQAALMILVLAAPVVMVFSFGLKAGQAPVIYDISTDWVDPPAIAKLTQARPQTANPLQQAAEVEALQSEHYPAVKTLHLQQSQGDVLARVKAAALAMGWRIEALDDQAGVLEATDRTFWFGFVDDVTVRIRPVAEGGVLVDVRSVSRVGKSDLGKNADRVIALLAALKP